MASSDQSSRSQSCKMGGDQVGLYDRHVGTPKMQLTTHRRGRLDQCLHIAPNRGREGGDRSETFIHTIIASVSLKWRVGSYAPTVGHT